MHWNGSTSSNMVSHAEVWIQSEVAYWSFAGWADVGLLTFSRTQGPGEAQSWKIPPGPSNQSRETTRKPFVFPWLWKVVIRGGGKGFLWEIKTPTLYKVRSKFILPSSVIFPSQEIWHKNCETPGLWNSKCKRSISRTQGTQHSRRGREKTW